MKPFNSLNKKRFWDNLLLTYQGISRLKLKTPLNGRKLIKAANNLLNSLYLSNGNIFIWPWCQLMTKWTEAYGMFINIISHWNDNWFNLKNNLLADK